MYSSFTVVSFIIFSSFIITAAPKLPSGSLKSTVLLVDYYLNTNPLNYPWKFIKKALENDRISSQLTQSAGFLFSVYPSRKVTILIITPEYIPCIFKNFFINFIIPIPGFSGGGVCNLQIIGIIAYNHHIRIGSQAGNHRSSLGHKI